MKTFQSGSYVQQPHYRSFQPSLIHRAWTVDDMDLLQLLGRADRELEKLDMYSEYVPNIDLFIRMHVLKEATQSSKIEGTQTNMEREMGPGPIYSLKLPLPPPGRRLSVYAAPAFCM